MTREPVPAGERPEERALTTAPRCAKSFSEMDMVVMSYYATAFDLDLKDVERALRLCAPAPPPHHRIL